MTIHIDFEHHSLKLVCEIECRILSLIILLNRDAPQTGCTFQSYAGGIWICARNPRSGSGSTQTSHDINPQGILSGTVRSHIKGHPSSYCPKAVERDNSGPRCFLRGKANHLLPFRNLVIGHHGVYLKVIVPVIGSFLKLQRGLCIVIRLNAQLLLLQCYLCSH
ncbi:hypothetical protein TFKS16_1456 [Tannerella forsythia KS16]|nr:hypothetical protein TFKS16_1456 [Tannerella forsythia KS16]